MSLSDALFISHDPAGALVPTGRELPVEEPPPRWLRALGRGLLSLVAPVACLSCSLPLPRADPSVAASPWPNALCQGCHEELSWIGEACLGCGRGLGPGLPSSSRCPSCVGQARGRVAATIALWRYRGPGRTLVRRLKYESLPALGPALGAELAQRVREALPTLRAETLVVPIPLHPLRRVARGYNQAHEVARGLSSALGLELGEPLRRTRYTRALYGVPRQNRARVVQGAFGLDHKTWSRDQIRRPILLVDDVRTSGATLRAAARALHFAGAGPIRAAVLAR